MRAANRLLARRAYQWRLISQDGGPVTASNGMTVVAEGVLAPVELISTLGNVLSYARIMAVGTASVMMAVVANRMTNVFGGVVVGVICALLFHLVNFVLGVFSPTIHMLRLHYVEFFGKFFSPGGAQYQPFRHWSPRENAIEERSA